LFIILIPVEGSMMPREYGPMSSRNLMKARENPPEAAENP